MLEEHHSFAMLYSYKELIVWQRAIELATATYQLTDNFPSNEKFGLVSQMRRAAVSVASNIAEGRSRTTRKEFSHFLRIAHGSAAELETQLIIAKKVYAKDVDSKNMEELILEMFKMLNSMLKNLNSSAA